MTNVFATTERARPKTSVPGASTYVFHTGYEPMMFELWFEDDRALAERRQVGMPDVPPTYPPHAVAIRPVTRDASGV